MKVKLLPTLFLIISQFSFSQNGELLQGKVFNQNLPIQGVDVINYTTKVQTKTDQKGDFSIAAKTNDLLIFISKEYEFKRLLVSQSLFDKNSFSVFLNLKPEELREVLVTKTASIKLSTDKVYEEGKATEAALDKAASKPKTGVYDGTIENGMNFMAIGKMILDLFIKEKEPKKEPLPKIEFAVLAKSVCDQKFYLETLKLKPEEIDLFLQFCSTDPKSKALIENHNVLSMMDFLTVKNIQFQKLNSTEK